MAAKPRPSTQSPRCCGRLPEAKEVAISELGLDRHEQTTLQILRFFFQAFACPQSHGWVHALETARLALGAHGAGFAHKVLDAMKAVRCTRRSTFTFNAPTCPGCAALLTEHERRLMMALSAIRHGQHGHAQLELMMLCEGNDVTDAMQAFSVVADAMPEPALRERMS